MKLTALAKGQPCRIRLPGCDGGGLTTVACHYRSLRLGAGMAKKPDDLFIAFGCARCHDLVDARRFDKEISRVDVQHAHLLGVLETQNWLLDNGYIKIGAK